MICLKVRSSKITLSVWFNPLNPKSLLFPHHNSGKLYFQRKPKAALWAFMVRERKKRLITYLDLSYPSNQILLTLNQKSERSPFINRSGY